MRVKEFITEADFAAWKNNRNLQAPAGATLAQANKNANAVPTNTPGTLASLAKMGQQATPTKSAGTSFGDKMDWLKGQMYRFAGGAGGTDGHIAATKNIFINNFAQEYSQIINSAKRSGLAVPDMKTYVTDYLEQNNWPAKPGEIESIIASSGDNIRNVANGVYVIGMRNARGGKNRVAQAAAGAQAGGQVSPTTAGGAPVDLAAGTEKIIQILQKMSGSANTDDLEKIALAALNKLYGINKSEYAALRKSILSGQQQTQQEPTQGNTQ